MNLLRFLFLFPAVLLPAAELRFSIRSDPRTLDPLQVSDQSSEAVRYLTTARLARLHPKSGRVEPELAASWSVRDGNRTLVFRLRRGVRFSDGSAFTVRDVTQTVQALLDPARKLTAGEEIRSLGIESVTAPNNETVEIRFRQPVASPERFFTEFPIVAASSGTKQPPVLGPFVMEEYQRGTRLRFRRNPYYLKSTVEGQRLPRLDSVVLEILATPELERAAWHSGRIHLLESVDAALFDELTSSGAARNNGASPEAEVLWFNLNPDAPISPAKQRWFQNRLFRQAVSGLIRREDLVRIAFRTRATPATGPFAEGSAWLRPSRVQARPDGAAILRSLEAAGFHRDRSGALRDSQGEAVAFSIATNASNRSRMQMLTLIQADLARAGIAVTIAALDMPSLLERMSKSKQYDAILLGLIGVDDDPNHQMNIWLSSSVNHPWRPSQTAPATSWEREIDELLRGQFRATSQQARRKLLWRLQEIIEDERPLIYLVHPHVLSAASPLLRYLDPSVGRPRLFWNIDVLDVAASGGR